MTSLFLQSPPQGFQKMHFLGYRVPSRSWNVDVKDYEMAVVRHDTASLIVEGRVVEAKGVGLEDGTFFGVGDHPIHSLAVVVFVLCLNIYIYIFGCIK